jgi:2-phosphosulfolactate phosphatase
MAGLFGHGEHVVRFDWGPSGAQATRAVMAVVVDVLSFSTTVTVAVERGMRVFPYRWHGRGAAEFAARSDAALAMGRLEATRDGGVRSPSGGAAPVARTPIINIMSF